MSLSRAPGTAPCRNCSKTARPCEASKVLQRNTRVRGFVTDDAHIHDLESRLIQCQQALNAERDATASLRQQLTRQGIQTSAYPSNDTPALDASPSLTGLEAVYDESAHIIKHMGRLVHDENGVGRFAGSTTGVHFVLSVEEACKQAIHLPRSFPECCYSLYLVQATNCFDQSLVSDATRNSPLDSLNDQILECLTEPYSFYMDQFDYFLHNWEAFCPVLTRKQFGEAVYRLYRKEQGASTKVESDASTLCILLSIISINQVTYRTRNGSDDLALSSTGYMSLAARMKDHIAAHGDISGLQALVLFAFYHQLTGQTISLIRLNGAMVRIAQSLGLHRHARRFRMSVAEIELRKRIWWWVYIFDRFTAIVHGLPPLITDADVDNDMPTDCHLQDLDAAELLYPLPGETTSVFLFNHYVNMGKKISSILELLYTTTQRRHGTIKIARLNRDMSVWSQNLDAVDDNSEPSRRYTDQACDSSSPMGLWLRLLTEFALLLIHRPGLTFDGNTLEFANCLVACTRSSTNILHILRGSRKAHLFRSLFPFGPGLVFQCALMHVFCQCKSSSLNLTGMPSLHQSIDDISKAIEILEIYRQDFQPVQPAISNITTDGNGSESIDVTIEVLKDLTLLLRPDPAQPTMHQLEQELLHTPQINLPTSSIHDLNYMTAMDWAQEISDTFVNLPNLGG
ncbi:fungal-specific transcription factor domain-containing protein [Aspergillus californicus]